MSQPIPLLLAVEDVLQEVILRRILAAVGPSFAPGACYKQGGYGYLKKKISGFNVAAKGTPFLVLTDLDLDKGPCASALIDDWLRVPRHPNLIFRVAVRSVESWILADRSAFAGYLGLDAGLLPENLDEVERPRSLLIDLARRSRRRQLREALVPKAGSTAGFGPGYNGALTLFLDTEWRMEEARQGSPSLERSVRALERFKPASSS